MAEPERPERPGRPPRRSSGTPRRSSNAGPPRPGARTSGRPASGGRTGGGPGARSGGTGARSGGPGGRSGGTGSRFGGSGERSGGAQRSGGARGASSGSRFDRGSSERSGGARGAGPRSRFDRESGERSGGARGGGSGSRFGGSGERSGGGRPRSGTSGSRSGGPTSRAGGPAGGRGRRDERAPVIDERTKRWGGVARRGTQNLKEPKPGTAAETFRKAAAKADRDRGRPPVWSGDQWHDAGPVADDRRPADRPEPPKRRRATVRPLPPDIADELGRGTSASRATRDHERLQEAAVAYSRERYRDARALLVPLAERVPGASAVRELLGLTYYRMGRWRDAIKELEAFAQLTGSVDQHPVLMDAHRALGHRDEVERLWDDLRRTGAGVEIVIEGRIVLAGASADRGDIPAAIRVLEQGPVDVRRPQEHHLRLWYALASMYERAGDVARARTLFTRLVRADPEFADAASRLDALS